MQHNAAKCEQLIVTTEQIEEFMDECLAEGKGFDAIKFAEKLAVGKKVTIQRMLEEDKNVQRWEYLSLSDLESDDHEEEFGQFFIVYVQKGASLQRLRVSTLQIEEFVGRNGGFDALAFAERLEEDRQAVRDEVNSMLQAEQGFSKVKSAKGLHLTPDMARQLFTQEQNAGNIAKFMIIYNPGQLEQFLAENKAIDMRPGVLTPEQTKILDFKVKITLKDGNTEEFTKSFMESKSEILLIEPYTGTPEQYEQLQRLGQMQLEPELRKILQKRFQFGDCEMREIKP